MKPQDSIQKTWIPEGTKEYDDFKRITQENEYLAKYLQKQIMLRQGDLVLDVGGREGDISIQLQKAEYIHIIDPDPTLTIPYKPELFVRKKIQDVSLTHKYKLIIGSHIWGYLGNQQELQSVFHQLIDALDTKGTLALSYNTNTSYMDELLQFSKKIFKEENYDTHYDYFNEKLIHALPKNKFKIDTKDVSFNLEYKSFEELSRACWFLFGANNQDIHSIAKLFSHKLESDLCEPHFDLEERIVLITKR